MKKICFVVLFLTVWSLSLVPQELNLAISSIPDSLSKNADAVIRYENSVLSILDNANAVLKVKEIKTILRKSGIKHAILNLPYSEKFVRIMSIQGTLYDQFGKEKSKLKKTDINDVAAYDGYSLYTDQRRKYVKAPVFEPPYTVEYEYEIQITGLYNLPDWQPVSDEKISVEKSIHTIRIPENIKFHSKEINSNYIVSDVKIVDGMINKTYELSNFKATDFEIFNNNYEDYFPCVKFRLSKFIFDGYEGSLGSWDEFGNWEYNLLKDKDILPLETNQMILEMIKTANNDYEKAKIIYEYVQKKTRYVNIMEGIGSLQPFDASIVDKNGYGDCKSLSNYTIALLKVAGIKAYFTTVYAGNYYDKLIKDFPSHQFNHVIVCLPIENDTVWLECTDQDKPFGYLGTFTDDRDVLFVDSNGKGKLSHTTVYPENINTGITIADILIDEIGSANVVSNTTYSGLQYDFIDYILKKPDSEKEKEINEIIAIPNMKINSFSYENIKERIPTIIERLNFSVLNYASLSSGRMFLVPNMFNKIEEIPPKIENRKTDIEFLRGFTYIDTIIYKLPHGYEIEYLPENTTMNSIFGIFNVSYHIENQVLTYIRKYVKHKGVFSSDEYENLRQFYKIIYTSDKKSIVLKKL